MVVHSGATSRGVLSLVPGEGPGDVYPRVFEAFSEVVGAMGDVRDLDDLLRLIARKICELTGVSRCSVYLRDDSTGLYPGQVGYWHTDIDERVKRLIAGLDADGMTREILSTHKPVSVNDTQADPRPMRSAMRQWHVRSILGVPMLLNDDVVGLIYLDDEDRLRTFAPEEIDIASVFANLAAVAISQARLTVDLRTKLMTVARQNAIMRSASSVDDRIRELALEGRSVSEIVEAVAELSGKPVAVHDADGNCLAGARPPGLTEPITPHLLDPEIRRHPEVAAALASLDDGRPAVIQPVAAAGLTQRTLANAIMVRGERLGTIVIAEYRSRFGGADMRICKGASSIVALEMAAERRELFAHAHARSALVGELIYGITDLPAIERRASSLGVRLRTPHVLALVAAVGSPRAVALDIGQVAAAVLSRVGPHTQVVATGVPEGVVLLVELDQDRDDPVAAVKEATRQMCAELDPDAGLRAGLSLPFACPSDMARAYLDARQVLRCMRSLGSQAESVLVASDLGPARVFLANSDAEEVTRFVQDTLGRLLVPGLVEQELLVTLESFLGNARSIRRSAVELDVHENTVRNRVARVQELIGLDVTTDAQAQLAAHLAVLVVRLRGQMPAASPA